MLNNIANAIILGSLLSQLGIVSPSNAYSNDPRDCGPRSQYPSNPPCLKGSVEINN